MSEDFEAATEGLGDGRRSFLKKMAIGTAFTVPVVSSFTMAGIQAVYAQTPTASGKVSAGNASNSSHHHVHDVDHDVDRDQDGTNACPTSTTGSTTRPESTRRLGRRRRCRCRPPSSSRTKPTTSTPA